LSAAGTRLVPVGLPHRVNGGGPPRTSAPDPKANRFAEAEALLDRITPWSGDVPHGFLVDFLGTLTDASFIWNREGPAGGGPVATSRPTVAGYGEGYVEIAAWLLAARDARERFVAVSLGAAFGAQLVIAFKALQAVNPLPCRLVAVEPVPEHCRWMRRHMQVNGIDPDAHCIIQAAVGCDNEPVLFPLGVPGTGRMGCTESNAAQWRQSYAGLVCARGQAETVLENILIYNSTGLTYDMGDGCAGELRLVSAVTIGDVLAPFDRVDMLEADLQASEVHVIPPFIDALTRKVARVHLGTHGREAHDLLRALFLDAGWETVFDFPGHGRHETESGTLDLIDGILSLRNPGISNQ
jgi:hypothetical protein